MKKRIKCIKCGAKEHLINKEICKKCYYKEYWKNNPEKYKEHREKVKEYKKTDKGRIVYEKAKRKFLKNNPHYNSIKSKKLRDTRREKGLCISCGGKRDDPQFLTCSKCRRLATKRMAIKRYHSLVV